MKIAVLDDYADALRGTVGLDRLRGHDVTVFRDSATTPEALVARLAAFDAVLAIQQRTALPREILTQLPKLRMIAQTGKNTGHIDLEACTRQGIVVSARGTGLLAATAELTWGLVIAALRDLPRQIMRLKAGQWLDGMGLTLAGRTLGVYGFGGIGSRVAAYGRAFEMNVVCWGRESSNARASAAGFAVARDRHAFFAESDVVSLHLTLNAETRGIVTADDLAAMKPTALIVNTSRAGLIAPGVLETALRAGRPGHAALDVFAHEPLLDAADPLLQMPNVVCTPHLGYSVREMYAALFDNAVGQLLAFAAGTPIDVVNPGVAAPGEGR
jgi:D-3-phosphoglycerate dehydrogenase